MAQKLDRSYFGTSTRSTANHTTEQRKEEAPSAGGTAQKLDRSYFNKPKSAPNTGAASQARNGTVRDQVRSNSTTPSRQQWTATGGGRKSTTNAGKTTSTGTQMQGTTVNNRGFSGSSRKIDKPTFAERVGKTIAGGAKGYFASDSNAMSTFYAMGQGGRDAQTREYLAEYSRNLERAKLDMDAMLAENREKPGSWSEGYIQSQQRIIDDWQRKYDAMAKVLDEHVQQKATKASYELADRIQQSSTRDLNRAKEGAGYWGKLLVDAGANYTQTGIDAAISAASGGVLGMAPFAMRAFGGATQQARQENPDSTLTQQALYGTASAGIEVFTEMISNIAAPFAKAYGGGALDDVVKKGIRSAVDKFVKTEAGKKALGSALTFGVGAVGEGLEEFIGDWMEWQLPRIYGGDVATAQETLSNSLYDFLVGATAGAMGGVVSPNTYRYDLSTTQQGVQERADVQEGTPTAPVQTNAQTTQETAQEGIQDAVQRQTASNPVSAEEQVLRQREAAVQKTFTGIADTLGDSGKKAFQAAYQGTDRGDYAGEFLRAYHAGMTNQENPNSTSAVSFAAYAAGQNDAAVSLAREKRAAQFAKTAGTDSGLVFDDYVSREMDSAVADEVNTVAKALGVRVQMADQVLGGQANGQISGSDVLIAKDAVDPALQVVGHEWTHRVQELAPEQYRAFRDAVTSMPDVQEAANILLDQYNRAGVETSYEQALDEATANYAGEMIANSDALDDFIRKHSGNRTLLQKLRDAIHEIVGKLTGRAKRQAQTVEGKLQAAFEAASKQAESLQNRDTNGTISETRYAAKGKYWRPNLTQKEWSLLNRHMEQEIADSTHTLDEATQWAYANEKGNQVFAIYGIGDGTEATPLYAVGGKKAAAQYEVFKLWMEGSNGEIDRNRKSLDRIFEDIKSKSRRAGDNVSAAERGTAADGNVRISLEERGGNGTTDSGSGQENRRVSTKFSLKTDSQGRELTEQQRAFFKDSKVVDSDGQLKVMYRGGTGDFTVFDRKKSSYSNLYGRGFYFTDSEAHAKQYGNAKAFYLNITEPVSTTETTITRDQMRKFLKAVAANEDDFSFENYGYDATVSSVLKSVYGKSDFAMLYDVNQTAIGDMVAAVELFNEVNGTNYDGLILDTETVAFQSNQIKNVDNKAPTSNPDIRYSLKTYSDAEQRDHRKKAIAFFGKTYNWNETGYLTPAGTKLDFSGKHEGGPGGYRTVDHRDIRDAIGEDYGGDDYSGSMVQFMSEGNIRISPESGGINLSVEPTKSQLDALSDFIGKNRGEVILDLDTPDGQTVSSTEYPRGTHSSKVLNDIKAYFKDGTKPHVSELAQFLSLKGTENAQEIAALKRENENLKERVDYWKGQTRRSQGVTTDRKAVQKAADALVKDYGAEISGSDIAGDLQSLYDYIASGKDGKDELTYTEARRRSDAIAERIAESAVEVDDRAYKEYAGLRKYLKDTKLTLTEADATEITDFNEFRKSLFGKLKISRGEHTNVDQIYSELASQYPEFFNEERETNISDQVQRIADVANQLYNVTEYNPFEGYMGQAVASISNDIMDRFFDLPQTKKTFADRAAEQVQEARFAGKQAASDAFLAGQMAQGRQDAKRLRSTAQALAKERTRRAEQVQALKERYREKDVTRRDNQKRRELRAKIVRHASALSQKLLRPTDNQHIPEDMRSAVAKVLESINQESSPNARSFTLDPVTKERIYKEPGTPTNRTVAFQNLKEQYQKIAQDGDMVVDPSLLGGDDVAGGFSEVIKMGDTRLADLTTEQLKTMWNVLKSVEHSVTTAGKTLASEKFATTKQFADALRMDGMTRRRKLGNNVAISLETPYTFFAHFGQTGKDIYRMLRNAQDRQEIMARDVAEKVHQILGDAKTGIRENAVTSMNEEVHHFTTTEGRELDLTTAQAMELYLLSERKQAEDHLLKGGIVQPEIKIPGKTKIPRGTDVIHLSAEDIQSIVKALTPEQIRIADGLQKLTTGILANYGNEASMKAYGYKKFTESDYWPIKSAKEALHSSQEKDSGNVRSIKNIGMAQAVKPNAATPLSIRGVFDTFADHASDMIDYAAWLCPMEDANRLYNFQFRDSEGNLVQTVKGFLEEKGGQGSQQYWQKLMGDIQNGIKAKDFEPLTDKFAKGIGSFKGAAVGANVRVVIQQPTAFFRASAVLDPADMARGLTGGVTKGNGWEKALTHSPIAMRKDVGSFDISSPYTLNDRFYGKEGIANKINDKAGTPAGKADAVTWGALWNACEWQVKRERPNLRAGSGEFYSAVNEVFTSMIDQTQVVDGILQRSNIMRGKSDLAKQATSFMGEPIMSLNVFMRAWDNMRYEENPAKRSKAIKTVGRAAAALLVTDVVNALAQSIADAGRDDDPDKDYWEKFLTALTGVTGDEESVKELLQHIVLEGNLGSNINKVGNVPFVKDILSLVQGYSVSRTDMQVFSDIVSASKDFINSMGGSGKKTREEAMANMFAACSKLFGLPVSNIKRDAMAAVRTAVQAAGSVALEYEVEKLTYNIYSTSNKDRYMGLAFKALEQGDLTTYEHIRKELKDYMAVDSTSVDSGMQSRLEKKQEKDGDYRLPQNAASLIGAKDSYDDSEGEDKFTENDLSSDDYIVYSRRKSELYSSMESGLKNSQAFQGFTGEQKDKALSSTETYAKKTALHETDKTYEITDKWVLKAQEAQQKYGIKPEIYVALKTQVSEIESVKDRNGETIPNSKGLLIMQAVYNMPGLSEKQRNALFEYLGVGKSIRHYNKALVNEKVRKNARLAGK